MGDEDDNMSSNAELEEDLEDEEERGLTVIFLLNNYIIKYNIIFILDWIN